MQAGLRILIVEDHPFQRTVTAEALRTLGIAHVTTAADGESALAQLRAAWPVTDIVILDLGLPGISGVDLIRHIASQQLARALILCSAAPHPEQQLAAAVATARGLQVLGYIDKPMSVRDLEGLIETLDYEPPPAAA